MENLNGLLTAKTFLLPETECNQPIAVNWRIYVEMTNSSAEGKIVFFLLTRCPEGFFSSEVCLA